QFDNKEFLAAWDDLHQRCPWQTIFQSRAFVHTWYRLFNGSYLPVIIRTYKDQTLTGLFTLAKTRKGNMITGAGGEQAEYQVWLSQDNDNNQFIKEALTCVQKKFPEAFLMLRYVPSGAPKNWLVTDKNWQKKSVIRMKKQPLMQMDRDLFEKRLNAKTIREKIKRLQRLGDLKLQKVTEYDQFAAMLDELIIHYEFRKGATYNVAPFTTEPNKKTLLLELFRLEMLHVTVLKLNEEIISSTVNTIDGKRVMLKGLNAHVPFYSKHSPGLLHLLMLGKYLSEEGMEAFDLTPGDDFYKDKLATLIEEPAQVWITSNRVAYYKLTITESLKKAINNRLIKRGMDPRTVFTGTQKATDKLRFLKQRGIRHGLNKVKGLFSGRKKNQAYVIRREPNPGMIKVKKNNLYDLLQFDAKGSRITRWEFLAEAMKRFEYGEHAFTFTENGQLMACAWLRGKYSVPIPDLNIPKLPEESAVIHAIYTHSRFTRLQPFLNAVAEEVSCGQNKRDIYLISENMSPEILSQADPNGSLTPINDKDSYYQ
ncbi:MAG TPA: GNAT family N-acetyltransferase, partial [Sphingobacteriaceae bacterium]